MNSKQRASSVSNIPVPAHMKRSMSNDNLRKKSGLRRSNSFGNLTAGTVSSQSRVSNLRSADKRSVRPSRSQVRKTTATPLRNLRIPTPTSSRSTTNNFEWTPNQKGKSPQRILITQDKLSNKKWVAEQFGKLCQFLEVELETSHFTAKQLKPFTINSFFEVSQIIFKRIDSRIDLNMANFKEVVPKYLKLFGYPAHFNNSLFKTVNVMHHWPSLVAMLAWLVDLIELLETEEPDNLETAITNYIADDFLVANETDDNMLDYKDIYNEKVEKILKIDDSEMDRVENGLADAIQLEAQKATELETLRIEVTELQTNTVRMQKEIHEFENVFPVRAKQLKDDNASLALKVQSLEDELKRVQAKNASTKSIVANQKYSQLDIQKLKAEEESLEHTKMLEEEKKENVRKLNDKLDLEFQQTNKEIEKEVYRINGPLHEQSMVFADFQKLALPAKGFWLEAYKQEVTDKWTMFREITEKVEEEICKIKEKESSLIIEYDDLSNALDEDNAKSARLVGEIDQFDAEIRNQEIITEEIKNIADQIWAEHTKKGDDLEKRMYNVDEVKEKITDARKRRDEKRAGAENFCRDCIEFMLKTKIDLDLEMKEWNKVMETIRNKNNEMLEIQNQQMTDLLERIHQVESVRLELEKVLENA